MRKLAAIVIVLFVVLLIGLFFTEAGRGLFRSIEGTGPTIEVVKAPQALGKLGGRFSVKIADEGAGIGHVRVVAVPAEGDKAGQEQVILEQEFTDRVTEKELEFELPKDSDLLRSSTKSIAFNVQVRDRTFRNNEAVQKLELAVDVVPPRLEMLTTQHNVAQGGIGLGFYKLHDDVASITVHGIRVGEKVFRGTPARAWDSAFEGSPNVFGTFFLLPFDRDDGQQPAMPKAFAEDAAGNAAEVPLPIYVIAKKQPAEKLTLGRQFLETKIVELANRYKDETGKPIPEMPDPMDTLTAQFLYVNREYRAHLGQRLFAMLEQPTPEKFWDDTFIRPMAAKPTARFFERRTYEFEGRDLGQATHEGVDLASVRNDEVFAANRGRVVFADYLGIYGNAVILDHGLGLSTLYGHLASSSVPVGTIVEKGQAIGRSGETGLAGGDHLHYEIRVHGWATSPFEWWDSKWIADRVTRNIESVKDFLGLSVQPGATPTPAPEAKTRRGR